MIWSIVFCEQKDCGKWVQRIVGDRMPQKEMEAEKLLQTLLSFLQTLLQERCVHTVLHQKLSVQVKHGDVVTISIQPHAVLRPSDVHLLQLKLTHTHTADQWWLHHTHTADPWWLHYTHTELVSGGFITHTHTHTELVSGGFITHTHTHTHSWSVVASSHTNRAGQWWLHHTHTQSWSVVASSHTQLISGGFITHTQLISGGFITHTQLISGGFITHTQSWSVVASSLTHTQLICGGFISHTHTHTHTADLWWLHLTHTHTPSWSVELEECERLLLCVCRAPALPWLHHTEDTAPGTQTLHHHYMYIPGTTRLHIPVHFTIY